MFEVITSWQFIVSMFFIGLAIGGYWAWHKAQNPK